MLLLQLLFHNVSIRPSYTFSQVEACVSSLVLKRAFACLLMLLIMVEMSFDLSHLVSIYFEMRLDVRVLLICFPWIIIYRSLHIRIHSLSTIEVALIS